MKASLVTMFVMMLAAASGRKLAENLGFGVLGDGASYIPCGAGRDPCNLYGPNMVCCRAMLLESGAPTNAYCVAGDMCPAEDIIDGLFAPAAEQSLEASRRVLAEDSLPPTDVDSIGLMDAIPCGAGRDPCNLYGPNMVCCRAMLLESGAPTNAYCVAGDMCPAEDIIDGLFAPAAEQSLEALRRVLAEDSLPPTDVDSANVGLIACGGGRPPCHLRSPLLECCPDVNMGLATGGPAHAHCVRIGLCPVWNSEEQPAN